MRQIAIVTYEQQTAAAYAGQLESLFGEYLSIRTYSMESNINVDIDADVILASTHAIYSMVCTRAKNYRHMLVADLTLTKEMLQKLRGLPKGTRGMLVNSTLEMAVETIDLIHNAGIDHIELQPMYPGAAELPECDLAITPGEIQLVPRHVAEIINLGHRVLSVRTIVSLAAVTQLSALLSLPSFEAYFQNLVQGDSGLEKIMEQMSEQEKQLGLLMHVFSGGVLAVSGEGVVTLASREAESILGHDGNWLVGKKVGDIIPGFFDMTRMTAPLLNEIMTINDSLVAVSVHPASSESPVGVILMKRLSDVEREQLKIRRQVLSKGHVARYTFDDIIGTSESMKALKHAAGRMARSPSSILIYGPSGAGKELFAQSIHNASGRSAHPFIAINCAAIPEHLLESELFGYSEGAFTGAKKGGKPGYFEFAHNGTLFLDEVGEMSLNLQSQLLRVLQEKAVIRVGGDSVINVDVRIISASNKKLHELVRRNLFREDLYYRLNVLSLDIPPLNRRAEDIPLLIRHFMEKLGGEFEITPEAMDLIQRCHWRGNIRELGNFVERITCLDKRVIDLADATAQIDEGSAPVHASAAVPDSPLLKSFLACEEARLMRHKQILEVLADCAEKRRKIGRQGISEELERRGVFLSPQEVRTLVKIQQAYGLVTVLPGRGGTEIKPQGRGAIPLLGVDKCAESGSTG